MNIPLPWGSGTLDVAVPDSWEIVFPEEKIVHTGDLKPAPDIVQESLDNPVDMEPLSSKQLGGKKILVIVDDNTRPTPTFLFFHTILESLKSAGAEYTNITVMPALGIHTPMGADDAKAKIGADNYAKITWKNHDAFDKDENIHFGTLKRGTEVYLNKAVKEADFIVLVGLIEPHIWAGFGGGMKNILPGVAYVETIGGHHKIIAENPDNFNASGTKPDTNPFRMSLEETYSMIDTPIFCVNVLINHNNEVLASFAGDPISCHRKGIAYCKEISAVKLDKPVDAIIVNSFPMDFNFKQSMKGVGNAIPALKPGGLIMGFLKADRGVDDIKLPKKARPLWFMKILLKIVGKKNIYAFLEKQFKDAGIEEKFLIYYTLQLVYHHNLLFYAPSINKEEAQKLFFFKQCRDAEEVIRKGVNKIGKKARVAVFLRGGSSFPVLDIR